MCKYEEDGIEILLTTFFGFNGSYYILVLGFANLMTLWRTVPHNRGLHNPNVQVTKPFSLYKKL